MKKKKGIVISIIVILILAAGGVGIYQLLNQKNSKTKGLVYVESVSNITGLGYLGENRYMGIVESQESKGVEKDSDKKVKEIFVEVGAEVKEGDPLFEYDTQEMELKLKELELELTGINNSITTANQQINALVAERDLVESDYKIEYTSQIQSLQAQVNQYNYDVSAKQLEIDRQKAGMENTIVYAPMDGVVKEINNDDTSSGDNDYDYYGGGTEDKAFISIMAIGDYRIKGTASELNVRSMSEGQPIIIRSRIDDSMTWKGTISSIDLEHPVENNNNYYYETGTTATNYPFYITLESTDDLMLGQHVYVELDYGQGDVKEGIWLDEYYMVQDGDNYYVWTENSEGEIEKRQVEVGDYDQDLWRYEIVSGLESTDYIAYPEDRITEGMGTTHNYQDIIDLESQEGFATDIGGDDDYPAEYDEDYEYYDDTMIDYEEDGEIIDDGYEEGIEDSLKESIEESLGNSVENNIEEEASGEEAAE